VTFNIACLQGFYAWLFKNVRRMLHWYLLLVSRLPNYSRTDWRRSKFMETTVRPGTKVRPGSGDIKDAVQEE
jgi:hypothetical protein